MFCDRLQLRIPFPGFCLRLRNLKYILADPHVEPAMYMRHEGGHFAAHFEEDGCWYTADDLGLSLQVAQRRADAAHAIPFVCFMEREASRARHAADCPWPPGGVHDGLIDAEGPVAAGEGTAGGAEAGARKSSRAAGARKRPARPSTA